MKVFLLDNQLCISVGNKIIAKDIKAYFRYRNKNDDFVCLYNHGQWKLNETEEGTEAKCDNALIIFTPYEKGMLIKTKLTNDLDDINKAEEFIPLSFQTDSPIVKAIGSEIRKSNGNRTNEMQAEVRTRTPVYGESLDFSDFSAVKTKSDSLTVLGFATSFNYFGNLEICGDGMVIFKQFYEYHPIAKGETTESDSCFILPCGDVNEGISNFVKASAKLISSESGTELPSQFTIPCGYCTWYYYYSGITGEKIVNSLDVIKKYADKIPLRYYQIDDGWYDYWGNWNANEKFPEGMKFYADKIKEAGLIPGLWIAPFGASTSSEIYKNHPEYFIHDWDVEEGSDGRHLGDWGYYNLDYSVPEVCEYMADIIRRITYDWGFGYIKLDIIVPEIGPYRHSDMSFNACRNMRKGLEVIRKAAKEGTFILGCTCSFVPAVGLVDGMRISGDIQRDWGTLKDVFGVRVLKRWYYQNTFFTNDADCLIIRKPENEDEDCRHHCIRNDREIRSYITAMAASGGALMLSDKLELLSDEQIKLITYLFPQNLKPAVPLDMDESNFAGILDFGKRGKIRIVALINWYDAPHTLSVKVGKKHVLEFWEKKYGGITDGEYSEEIEPHGCRMLYFTDTDEPVVIGSDSCIVPDIEQNYDGENLSFTFEKKDESLYISANELRGDSCIITEVQSGIYKVTQLGETFNVSLNAKY